MTTVNNDATWPVHHFYAMGSHMSAWLDLADQHLAQTVLHQVEALFQAAEARLTRFRRTSELAQVNAQAGQWTTVSHVFWCILTRALQLSQATNGLFDLTILNAVEAAGYDRDFTELAQRANGRNTKPLRTEQTAPCRLQGCWQAIELDPAQQAVRLPPNVRLDFGGIAKGETAQQAVAFLSQWGPCLVDAGGDLVAGDAPNGWPGWLVAIASPTVADEPERDLAQLWLKNSALATSGVDYRRWQQGQITRHHLIDPRNGAPATTDLLTVSVLATDAIVAEAWAKAALIVGTQAGEALLAERQMAAALVDQEQRLTLTPALQPFVQCGV
jgi:thiamine biosynthesis lipoprotein